VDNVVSKETGASSQYTISTKARTSA
jgi:hypothetical protein